MFVAGTGQNSEARPAAWPAPSGLGKPACSAWPCGSMVLAPACGRTMLHARPDRLPRFLPSAPCAVPADSLLQVLAQAQGDAAVREAIAGLVAAMNAHVLVRQAELEQQVTHSVNTLRHMDQQLQRLEQAEQAQRATIARQESELAEARREAADARAALHAAQQQQLVERSWASGGRPPVPQRPWWQVWAARGSMVAVGALVGAAIGVPIDRRVRRAHRPGDSGRGSRAGGMFEVHAQRAAKG